jgi:hypothetical protein
MFRPTPFKPHTSKFSQELSKSDLAWDFHPSWIVGIEVQYSPLENIYPPIHFEGDKHHKLLHIVKTFYFEHKKSSL